MLACVLENKKSHNMELLKSKPQLGGEVIVIYGLSGVSSISALSAFIRLTITPKFFYYTRRMLCVCERIWNVQSRQSFEPVIVMRIQIELKHLRAWRLSFYHRFASSEWVHFKGNMRGKFNLLAQRWTQARVRVIFDTLQLEVIFLSSLFALPPSTFGVSEQIVSKMVAVSHIKRSAQLTHVPFVISSIEWIYWACRTKIEINGYRSKSKCPSYKWGAFGTYARQ